MSLKEVEPYARITQTGRWSYEIYIVTRESPGGGWMGYSIINGAWSHERATRIARKFIEREKRDRIRRANVAVVR